MNRIEWADLPERKLVPGYVGRYAHSDKVTVGRVDIEAGAVLPEHSHPHEQWTAVLSGSLELTVAGHTQVLTPGVLLYIAPGEPHSARALSACQVMDIFHPARDDYR